MFPITSPTDLYEEYQARVAQAVRHGQYASKAQPKPGMLPAMLAWIKVRLTAAHLSPARHEVAEDGQLA